jgi:hypothetical protein
MGSDSETWSVEAVARSPRRGLRWPGPVVQTPAGLCQRHARWVSWLVPLGAVALPLAVVVYLLRPVPLGATGARIPGWLLSILPVFLLANVGTISLWLHVRFAGGWRLERRRGRGEIHSGPERIGRLCRRWSFPIAAVRQVVVGVEDRRRARRGVVQLLLQDAHDESDHLSLCTGPLERARAVARQVADWLGLDVAEEPFRPRRRPAAAVIDTNGDGGAKPISIPATPVGRLSGTNIITARLIEDPHGKRLAIGPGTGAVLLWGGFCAFGLLFVVFPCLSPGEIGVRVLLVCVGLAMAVGGALAYISRPRWRFDASGGEVRYRHGLRRWRRMKLSEIVAVQSVYVGTIRSGDTPAFPLYELNVVLRCGNRIRVTCQCRAEWIEDAAIRLAEFLSVPRVDHMEHREDD